MWKARDDQISITHERTSRTRHCFQDGHIEAELLAALLAQMNLRFFLEAASLLLLQKAFYMLFMLGIPLLPDLSVAFIGNEYGDGFRRTFDLKVHRGYVAEYCLRLKSCTL